jgi:type IV secretory pathway VirJ component
MSAAEYEVNAPDTDIPANPVELDRWIGWRLRRIANERAEMDRNMAVAKAEVERYTAWLEEENASHARSIEWLESQVRAAAQTYDFGSKRSRKLAEGTFGFRTTPGKTAITDPDAAVAFAKAKGIPVKESVGVREIKEWIDSTGEVPEFVEQTPPVDTFYVKAGT